MNFKKNEKTYDAEKSAVFKVLQEEASDPEPGMLWTAFIVASKIPTEIPADYILLYRSRNTIFLLILFSFIISNLKTIQSSNK